MKHDPTCAYPPTTGSRTSSSKRSSARILSFPRAGEAHSSDPTVRAEQRYGGHGSACRSRARQHGLDNQTPDTQHRGLMILCAPAGSCGARVSPLRPAPVAPVPDGLLTVVTECATVGARSGLPAVSATAALTRSRRCRTSTSRLSSESCRVSSSRCPADAVSSSMFCHARKDTATQLLFATAIPITKC